MRETSAMPGTRTNSDAGFQRGDANLARGFEREARMLHVDVEAVEAGRLGDPRDVDAANEPNGHRGDDLVAAKLLFDAIAQYFVDPARHATPSLKPFS
jgi:hypothetical protein